MNKGITLICPTYRNPKYLDIFLKSAVSGKVLDTTVIMISVDGFYEESKDVLEKYKNQIQILDLGENRGMQMAINLAIYQSNTDRVYIVNDDNIMPKNWDLDINELDCETTVWTIEQIEPTGPGMFNFTIHDFGRTYDTFRYDDYLKYAEENKSNKETGDGRIFPFLISKKNIMIVNGFDSVIFQSPNVCDWELFLRLELMGCTFKRTYKSLIYHFCSVSTKKNSESESFKQREAIAVNAYKYKWGFPIWNGENNTKIHPSCPFKPHQLK